jgi:hypothetical protein
LKIACIVTDCDAQCKLDQHGGNMTKHTPGPWVARRNVAFWEINPVNILDKGPYTVGDVCASDPYDADSGLQEANAKLIAQAPALLEALTALLAAPAHKPYLGLDHWRRAQEAVAAATGEAP